MITIILVVLAFLNGMVTMEMVNNSPNSDTIFFRWCKFFYCMIFGFTAFIYELILMIKQRLKLKEANKKPINKMSDNKDGAGSADNESNKSVVSEENYEPNTNATSALSETKTEETSPETKEEDIPQCLPQKQEHQEEEPIAAQAIKSELVDKIVGKCLEVKSELTGASPTSEDAEDMKAMVTNRLLHPEHTFEQIHSFWMEMKKAAGWVYGEILDVKHKIHPAMKEFSDLSQEQQDKVASLTNTVDSLK